MCEHMETEEHYVMSFERLRKLAADAGTPFGEDSSTIEPSMGANVPGEAGEKRFGFVSGAGCHD